MKYNGNDLCFRASGFPEGWLGYEELDPDLDSQIIRCYLYTIPQSVGGPFHRPGLFHNNTKTYMTYRVRLAADFSLIKRPEARPLPVSSMAQFHLPGERHSNGRGEVKTPFLGHQTCRFLTKHGDPPSVLLETYPVPRVRHRPRLIPGTPLEPRRMSPPSGVWLA